MYYYSQQIHKDWITSVVRIGDIQPSILTCSLDTTVKFFNVDKRKEERAFYGHKNSVQSLVYVRSTKCMASAGVGREILTWNPHTCTIMQTLIGHSSPVTHLVSDEKNSLLISVSMDKHVKLWDTSNWRCTQTSVDMTNYRPDNFLTACFWDSDLQQLVTAGNRIKLWQYKKKEGKEITCSHESSVCAALFNKNFQQVVSGDNASVVKVWNIETGQCVFRFDRLHGDSKITTMSFDWSMRRLITGAHDGSVKMWNFSNGSQLKEFITSEDSGSDGDSDDDDDDDEDDDGDNVNVGLASERAKSSGRNPNQNPWVPTTKWGKKKWGTKNSPSKRDTAIKKSTQKRTVEIANDTEVTAVGATATTTPATAAAGSHAVPATTSTPPANTPLPA